MTSGYKFFSSSLHVAILIIQFTVKINVEFVLKTFKRSIKQKFESLLVFRDGNRLKIKINKKPQHNLGTGKHAVWISQKYLN